MTTKTKVYSKKYDVRRQIANTGLSDKSEDILFCYTISKPEDIHRSFYEFDGEYLYFKTRKNPVVSIVSKQYLVNAVTETYFDARTFGLRNEYIESKNKVVVIALAYKMLSCLPNNVYLSELIDDRSQLYGALTELCSYDVGIELCLSYVQVAIFQLVKLMGVETEN